MQRIFKITSILLLCILFQQVRANNYAIPGSDDTTKKNTDHLDQLIYEDSLEALMKKIRVEFKIKKVEHSSDSIYFNVCKITNTENKTVTGYLKFRVPSGWNLIADPSMEITLKPNQSISLPVRTSIPPSAVGGIAYVIDGSVTTNEGVFSGATYVKIPLRNKWDFTIDNNVVYFNEFFDLVPFNLHIKNEGNSPELFKLDMQVGKLFEIIELDKTEFYIEVPPYTDTTLQYNLKSVEGLSIEDRQLYQQIWNESTVSIKVSGSENKTKKQTIWFKNLENDYVNQRQEKNTPLNINANLFNLLSNSPSVLHMMFFGQLLFNKDHDIDYVLYARNLWRGGTPIGASYFNNPNNLRYHLGYNWNGKLHAEAGLISNYTMHYARGNGVKGSYKISPNDEVRASFVQNQFLPIWVASGEYLKKIKSSTYSIGGAYESNQYVNYNAYSLQLGAGFSPAKSHFVNVQLMGTRANFTANDSAALGLTYFLSYNGLFLDQKLRVSLSTRNDQLNFVRIRPGHYINGNIKYKINENNSINTMANFNSTKPSRYTLSPLYNGLYNETQVYRVTYMHRFSKKVSVETGPMMRLMNRRTFDNTLGNTQDFNNVFFGLYTNARIRLDDRTIVTPNFSIGQTSFRNVLTSSSELPGLFTYTAGVSLTGRNYGVNANYVHGPNFFVSEEFLFVDDVSLETISIRAQMDKLLRNNTIKISGYGTYYLRLPSNRQNVILSARSDFYFPKGWTAYLTANIYTNSATSTIDEGIVTQRFFSLNLGATKAFGFQQPRIKYYDVDIICFNDFNGNGVREENEPLLPNIKVIISRDENYVDDRKIKWGEKELITSTEGSVSIQNMPNIGYTFTFDPLVNLGNLYNVNGDVQNLEITDDQLIYVPYAESYKVQGSIVLVRDEFSSKGLIKVGGVRVTATNAKGHQFSVLTDNDGNYLINVPQAGSYRVEVNNIFGDEFYIDKESFIVQFDGFKSYHLDFTFYEGKRKINFEGVNLFNFNTLNNGSDDGSSNQEDTTQTNVDGKFMLNADLLRQQLGVITDQNESTITNPVDPNNVGYMIEIGIFNKDVDTDVANLILTLGFSPTTIKIEGMTIYATPAETNHANIAKMLKDIQDAGLSEAVIVGIYEGKIISEAKAREYRNE